jgi:hypothetical protein
MDKFVKRIQTRLSRQGFSFNKQQIREVYQALVKEHSAPTEAEMSSVINKLKFQLEIPKASNTQLAIAEPEISQGLVEQIPQTETTEITPASHPDIWETLEPPAEQPEPQENAPAEQLNEALALTNVEENNPTQPSSSGIIPQNEVKGMVSQVFAGQPQEFKDQISDYAMQHSFENVRQVQEFLEQLRGMEFNLLVNTLQDHFKRRGSMLTVLNEVITSQKQKDKESSQSFFNSFQSRLASFQQEMEARLSKQSL